MLDANLKQQLQGLLTNLREPIELISSLGDDAKSAELATLLGDIAALSDMVSVIRADDDARRPSFLIRRASDANVAVRFAWAVQQCAGRPEADRDGIAEAEKLLTTALTPDGARNPLHGMLRPSPLVAIEACQRRVCCLRYLLPGVADCGSLCPLPPARRSLA